MKLLFDLNSTQSSVFGVSGGAEYTRAVFSHLAPRASADVLSVFYHMSHPLDPDVEALVQQGGFARHEGGTRKAVQALVSRREHTRFMSGLPYHYDGVDFSGLEVFLAIHGARPVEKPVCSRELFFARQPRQVWQWAGKMILPSVYRQKRRESFQKLVTVKARARRLIVPSHHTMGSLLDNLTGLKIEDFIVLDCPGTAVSKMMTVDPAVLGTLGLTPGRYFLMVSGNRWIKNTHRALHAAIAAMEKMPEEKWMPIVVTGGLPWGLPRTRRPYVVNPGTVGLEDLAALYAGAHALFYPSLNEGYGYPPLEAMSKGTAVLSSAVSSLTELLGDAAIYFNPTDSLEIRNRIRLALENPELIREYAARGKLRYREVLARQESSLDELCAMLLED